MWADTVGQTVKARTAVRKMGLGMSCRALLSGTDRAQVCMYPERPDRCFGGSFLSLS